MQTIFWLANDTAENKVNVAKTKNKNFLFMWLID